MPEKKPLIQVLDRALDLMEMLARSKTPLRATDIAREMGLSLQSANNLLRALYLRGYLSQDESRSYRLGPQCLYLGSFADRWSELRAAVAPALAELTREPVPESVLKAYGVESLEFGRSYLIPKPLDPRLLPWISTAVARAAVESGVARRPITDWEAYAEELRKRVER